VYQLCFIETVDGNLEENEDYCIWKKLKQQG
jgi:hypothetical protein